KFVYQERIFSYGINKYWGFFHKQSENKVVVARGGVFLEIRVISRRQVGEILDIEEIRSEQQTDTVVPMSEVAIPNYSEPIEKEREEEMVDLGDPPAQGECDSQENPQGVESVSKLLTPLIDLESS